LNSIRDTTQKVVSTECQGRKDTEPRERRV
jgi:hypothetical protein